MTTTDDRTEVPNLLTDVVFTDPRWVQGDIITRSTEDDLQSLTQSLEAVLEAVRQIPPAQIADALRGLVEETIFPPLQRYETYGDRSEYRDYQGRTEYCYCSPGRGMFFDRYYAAYEPVMPEPMSFVRWAPEPAPEPSKELVSLREVIPAEPIREVIPAPEPAVSRLPMLAALATAVTAVAAMGLNIVSALVR